MDRVVPPQPIDRSHRAAWLTVRTLGTLAACLGASLAYACVSQLIRHFSNPQSVGFLLWDVLVDVFLAGVAVWCLHSGYRAWRPCGDPPVRSLSAIFVLLLFSVLNIWAFEPAFGWPRPGSNAWYEILDCIAVLLLLLMYVLLTWWLAAALEIAPFERRVPEFVIFLAGLQIWVKGTNLLMMFTQTRLDEPAGPWPFPLPLLAVIAPIAAAVLVGRLLRRIGDRPTMSTHELFTK